MNDKNKKIITFCAAGAMLVFMFMVAFFSSRGGFGDSGDSATMDEVAHIPAGYSMAKYLDYRLNPEHPPLAKTLSGLALLPQKITGPKNDASFAEINQWDSGWYMLYKAGNDPAQILFWARLPIMLLMLILGIFVFKWAYELYGKKVALFVLALFVLYPDIIAHGRLVTTDVASALGFLVATYYFYRAVEKPAKKSLVFAGLALGVAELFKFSAVLLPIVFTLLIFLKAFNDRDKIPFSKNIKKLFFNLLLIFGVAIVLIWVVYVPLVWKTPINIEHQLIETNLTDDSRTQILRTFFHHLEGNPITRAIGHYLLGVMLVFGRVAGGNNTFIIGSMSHKAISWFFPVAWLIKTPITIILLSTSSIGLVIFQVTKRKVTSKMIWALSLFILPLALYWITTLLGSLDLGIRHLMPTIPFVLLLIGYFLSCLFKSKIKVYAQVIAVFLVTYMGWSVLSYYPDFIGYFNESVPKEQRYKYMIDSSLDWGQDLLRLRDYVKENKIDDMKIDYFGGSKPSYYIPNSIEWHAKNGPTTGWLAVSATLYQSSKLETIKSGESSYSWLDQIRPEAIIGGSILVYNIKNTNP